MGNPVVHFEVYGRNQPALKEFYEKAFGWEIHVDPQMGYGMIHAGAEAGKGIDGGLGQGDPRVNVVIEVPDLGKALTQIEELGGKTVTPITEMGQVTFAEFSDLEGNVLGIVKSE
jgi:predicted enzyme related to lactoylglutathione lyase